MQVLNGTKVRSKEESRVPEYPGLNELKAPSSPSSGLSCSIILLEPCVYLPGPDNRGHIDDDSNKDAIVRGVLRLEVTRNIKIKTVKLSLWGRARIANNAGQKFTKSDGYREEDVRYHVLSFFNANEPFSEDDFGSQCNYTLHDSNFPFVPNIPEIHHHRKGQDTNSSQLRQNLTTSPQCPGYASLSPLASSSSFYEKNEVSSRQNAYKIFYPGIYQYHFEIMLDCTYPETIKLPLGLVRWELQGLIERAGALRRNIRIHKEVLIIRVPYQSPWDLSLPMAMTRLLNNQMDCRIVILGRTFALGSKIPVILTTKLLDGIRCYSVAAYLMEQVGYFNDRMKETKFGGRRHILLFKCQPERNPKNSGEMTDDGSPGKNELPLDARSNLRVIRPVLGDQFWTQKTCPALSRRGPDASALEIIHPQPELWDNQNEVELDLHIPTCSQMKAQKGKLIHPSTRWRLMQVRHWIKVRIAFTSDKGYCFADVEIDVPIDIVSCLAGPKYTALPLYSHQDNEGPGCAFECGCPDAAPRSNF